MAFCVHCGASTSPSYRFCVVCGGVISQQQPVGPPKTQPRRPRHWTFWALWMVVVIIGVDLLAIWGRQLENESRRAAEEIGQFAIVRSSSNGPCVPAVYGFVERDEELYRVLLLGHGKDAAFAFPLPNGTTVMIEEDGGYFHKVRIADGELTGNEFYLSDQLTSYQWLGTPKH
jgi:hypothetical protein